MVEFLTLFLGLAAGPYEVAFEASEPVAAVAVTLDGRTVAKLEDEPWRAQVDLGTLRPQQLGAVAYDAKGAILDTAYQSVNVPRSAAEISVLLERDGEAPPDRLSIAWESRVGADPVRMSVRLDGVELASEVAGSVPLPALDPKGFHLIDVTLVFPGGVVASTTTGFGGPYLDVADAGLTAALVASDEDLADRGGRDDWLDQAGEPAEIVEVEQGPAEVVVVAGNPARRAIARMRGIPRTRGVGRLPGMREAAMQVLHRSARLTEGDRFRMLIPRARHVPGKLLTNELFWVTPPVNSEDGGILWHLLSEIVAGTRNQALLADAVATAGIQAATGNRRRAVVLVLAETSQDAGSRFDPATVRAFLRHLQVPLVVWRVGPNDAFHQDWGPGESFRSVRGLEEAVSKLQQVLDRQYVVWLRGAHLPNSIRPAAGVDFLDLAGSG